MKQLKVSGLQSAKRALGKRIRELRQKKGWSQSAFASLCSIDPSYVSRIERGNTNLRYSILYIIARKLEVSLFSLLESIS
jgi:transcriptional regulator with XRE-family HTH domain